MKYIILKSLIVQFFRALGYVALNYLWVIMESIVQVHDNSNENKEAGYMHACFGLEAAEEQTTNWG